MKTGVVIAPNGQLAKHYAVNVSEQEGIVAVVIVLIDAKIEMESPSV